MSDLQPNTQNIDSTNSSISSICDSQVPVFREPEILSPFELPISQARDIILCSNCSTEQLNPLAKFCSNCGTQSMQSIANNTSPPPIVPVNHSSTSPDAILTSIRNESDAVIKLPSATITETTITEASNNKASSNSNSKKRNVNSKENTNKTLKCRFCAKLFVNEINLQRHEGKFHGQLNNHYNQYNKIPLKVVENNNHSNSDSAHSKSANLPNQISSSSSSNNKQILRNNEKMPGLSNATVIPSTPDSISGNPSIISVSDSDSEAENNPSDTDSSVSIASSESNYEDENNGSSDDETDSDLDSPARKRVKIVEDDAEIRAKSASKKCRQTANTQLVDDEFINNVAGQFIEWLGKVSSNVYELAVKVKRITTESQLVPIKANLRFIFSLFIEQTSKDISTFKMEDFSELATCQKVYKALIKRGVKSARMHSIFLLIKKILVYLASAQSLLSNNIVSPHSLPSYIFVEQVCQEASTTRKMESNNRHLLYFDATSNNSTSSELIQTRKPFRPEHQHNIDMPNPLAEFNILPVNQMPNKSNQYVSVLSSNSVPSVPSQQDLSVLTKKALEYLDKERLLSLSNPKKGSIVSVAQKFAIYLCTVSFVLLTGPRTQVISNLIINHTFIWENNAYKIKMPGEMVKSRKAVLLCVPERLTALYTFYLQTIRPLLLKQPKASQSETKSNTDDCGYVFLNKAGTGKKTDFVRWVGTSTTELLGKAYSPHSFRSAIITAFYSNGANAMELYQLSKIMNHNESTQKNYYVKSDYQKSLVSAQERMHSMLGL